MNITQRLSLMKKQESDHKELVKEIKKLPRYNDFCCMDEQSDATQAEFDKCDYHQSWIDIVIDDGSDLITIQHCLVCGGRYAPGNEW